MENSVKFQIGGVPEHFNLPWRLAIEEGIFKKYGIELNWQDYPGGTGAMTSALRSGELDLAIVLTEGIVSDIINGNEAKILKIYVKSPLTWGIYVSSESSIQNIEQIEGKKYAISRHGSGSHLMAYVDAMQRGWNPENIEFIPFKNLDGIREGLKNNLADVFMWEKVMTQPYVASGELRCISECITPWSCFLLVARNEVLAKYPEQLKTITEEINNYCQEFKFLPDIEEIIANRYSLDITEVQKWLQQTEWAVDNLVADEMLEKVVKTLNEIKIVSNQINVKDLVIQL